MKGSIDDMVVFCRVVEAGSFTAAGDALSLSKGAVSKAVSRLESAGLKGDGGALVHRWLLPLSFLDVLGGH